MIRAVRCDQPSFKTVEFEIGMNVVLAERTQESTVRDSRNGLGKTTLIDIIHFCLGASAVKKKGLLQESLLGWTFSIDIDFRGLEYTVHRNTEKPSRVLIEGDCSNWPVEPQEDKETNQPSMSIPNWRNVLGWLMFDAPVAEDDQEGQKYKPTFRSLISYFIRRGRDAFGSPFEHHRRQREWDKQLHNAFLLGLNWEHAREWQLLKDNEDTLTQLSKAGKSGVVDNLWGTIGELEATKVRVEEQLLSERGQLDSFRVHPQYRKIEDDTNSYTLRIHQLINDNISDRRLVDFYEGSFREERAANEDLIAEVYEEAQTNLPDLVVKRLQDVREFHELVVANRRNFLRVEIERLSANVAERDELIRHFTEERAELMRILQSHGALEEHTELQQLYVETASQLEEVKNRIENLRKLEQGKSALRIDKERLQQEARADYEERRLLRERAISRFNANSEALYKAPGNLAIDVSQSGFKFQVEIERSTSQGIEQMKVFCYDLMLVELWSEKGIGPGFLVHDSTIFDGVDERQIAHALQLAARESKQLGFQYICCLNSDLVPWDEFEEGFDLKEFVRLTLTDASEDGGLLGIRF